MTTILHMSDTHGSDITVLPLDDVDIVIHSGDFMPTKGRRPGARIDPEAERKYQARWMDKNRAKILDWLGGRPMILVPGNHDFHNPTFAAPNVVRITNGSITLKGSQLAQPIRFCGYRFVPFVDGEWCGEKVELDIAADAKDFSDCDILITHAPPHGVLDYDCGRHWGSTALANEYLYRREGRAPKAWLCGHVHGDAGRRPFGETMVVNSATIAQRVEYRP